MTSDEPKPAASSPPRRPFQFGLRTLLLLFVVLGSSMAVFGAWGILAFVLVVGLAVYLREAKSPWSLTHLVLLILCLSCLLGWLLETFVVVARENSRRASCLNKIHNLALALKAYHETYGHFPPAFLADDNGKPMHSWRVLLLPFMEYSYLYQGLDLTQPWDGPKNKTALAAPLRDYECPSDSNGSPLGAAETSYVAVVGANAAWTGDKPRKLADFGDDPAKTIMLVEAINSGIAWAEPRDFSLDTIGPAGKNSPAITAVHSYGYPDGFFFKFDHGSGVHVAMADGSVGFIRTDNLSTDDLQQVLQIGGCKEGTIGARAIMNDDSGRRLNWPNIASLAVWLVSVSALLTGAVRGRKTSVAPPPKFIG